MEFFEKIVSIILRKGVCEQIIIRELYFGNYIVIKYIHIYIYNNDKLRESFF